MADSTLSPYRTLSRPPPTDPDIQATLSDFLTYTEHFPSHLVRALTLIHDQRLRSEEKIRAIHRDTTTYSILPSIKHDRPDPVKLRRDISYALEEAEAACRMSVEEASRMASECDREAKRLDIVVRKLKAQPMPPSRASTPEQAALTSPNLKRERVALTREDDMRVERHTRRTLDRAATKLRGRKIMVPGEVLPPPDPNAPLESVSEWSSPADTPPPMPPHEHQANELNGMSSPRQASRTPRPQKNSRERDSEKFKTPKLRGPRAPGQPGTNAHSSVAGISTSNALLALTAPPEGVVKGSKWLPWMKLTEWEMAKLRKRMKKNAIWVPSLTMVRRELKNLGRGLAGKEAAKAHSDATGEPFIDDANEIDPTTILVDGDEQPAPTAPIPTQPGYVDDDDADAELVNRGMRLNEAKKLKRQRALEEQLLQAQIAREQGIDDSADATAPKVVPGSPDAAKKRKRDTTPPNPPKLSLAETPDPLSKAGPPLKKPRTVSTATSIATASTSASSQPGATAIKIALAPAGASTPQKAPTLRTRRAATPPAASTSGQPSLTLKVSKAVSEEPPNRRTAARRSSTASMPGTSIKQQTQSHVVTTMSTSPTRAVPAPFPKPTRRSRRPVPGVLTNNDEEGAKVGVSKRKAAPRKRSTAISRAGITSGESPGQNMATAATIAASNTSDGPEEYIDPSEPRYCVCGDVSWGTMIACDNDDCEKEWFHLECVQLSGMPPRRTKWYCPDCRKKLKIGQTTNGLVGRNVGGMGLGAPGGNNSR